MAQQSTKDLFESEMFSARLFAAGIFRGPASAFYELQEARLLEQRPRHGRLHSRPRHGRIDARSRHSEVTDR